MRYDVIIIGAGLSGLAAGIRLAHFKKRVCILERHDRVGGLNSYYRAGGYNLDVGLHAITNYPGGESVTNAFRKIFRQLRIPLEDFDLCPQRKSRIVFPGAALEFTNEIEFLSEQVAALFPGERENFGKLVEAVRGIDEFDYSTPKAWAREFVSGIIGDPLLVEMIVCPLMYYGSAEEDDMELRQFVIMFKSIFLEGFARPRGGIRTILDRLLRRYGECEGELRLEAGVKEIIIKDGFAKGVVLDSGTALECGAVLSSIGRLETASLCGKAYNEGEKKEKKPREGRLAFTESINIYDDPLAEKEAAIVFYSTSKKFSYNKPSEPLDVSNGVICFPGNFEYEKPLTADMGANMVRITNRADYEYWESEQDYTMKKHEWYRRSLETAGKIVELPKSKPKFYDIFTPSTVRRYTGHINGAVYGSPDKAWSGATPVDNLFLCGTDQGFLGIVGAMLSGISITNAYLLK
ncbi:MAG: NAD(P)/FAD-dependent oxidoreductase [Nitrospinota bacterium]